MDEIQNPVWRLGFFFSPPCPQLLWSQFRIQSKEYWGLFFWGGE